MTTANIEYKGKDQNWQDGETTYWFALSGKDYGTEVEFDGEEFGVVESGGDAPVFVDSDGCSIVGDGREVAIRKALENAVTEEMRAE